MLTTDDAQERDGQAKKLDIFSDELEGAAGGHTYLVAILCSPFVFARLERRRSHIAHPHHESGMRFM